MALRGMTYNDESATTRTMMVLRSDTVYVIQSLSIYPDHPQFGRLANSFQFIA
jgi:hypothetical protein